MGCHNDPDQDRWVLLSSIPLQHKYQLIMPTRKLRYDKRDKRQIENLRRGFANKRQLGDIIQSYNWEVSTKMILYEK